ncbi:MAG: carboxypeptidase regulatory-like domain-containing protein [Acidobacteriota bacterium]
MPPALLRLCLVLLLPCVCRAQTADATLSGVIVDQNYAAIPAASVTLLDKARARARQIVTGADGTFTFALLPPGSYLLRANCEGFSPVEVEVEIENFAPGSSRHRAVRIQMQVGEIGASVNVTAERSAQEAAPPEAVLINREFIERLPLSGLTLQPLIALSPGIVLTRATMDEQGQFSANGQRANANYFTVDGVSANTGVTASFSLGQAGAGALPGLSATGGTNGLISIEALQEFKLQTAGFTAESARTPGALISVTTRSGSRDFHGSLFEYFRHDALAANDWFANRDGFNKAALRQHNFGGVLGGPVRLGRYNGRDRTHFFLSYEGLRLLQPLFGVTAVPSLAARAEASGAVKSLVDAYPMPNGENLGGGLARLSASYSDPTQLDAASVRLDQVISARQTLFARFNYAPSRLSQRAGSLSRVLDTDFDQGSLTVGSTQSFGARGGNDLRVNYSFAVGRSFNWLDSFGGATPPAATALFPAFATPQDAVTTIYVDGAQPLSLGKYVDNAQRQFNLVDDLALSLRGHQLKFGVDYRHLAPRNRPAAYDAAFNFLGVTGEEGFPAPGGTLLSATAFSAQIAARDDVSLVFHNFSAYGQDGWRVRPDLQLTFGLRWEFSPPPAATGESELYTVGDLQDLSKLAPHAGRLWQTGFGNFAPRLGLAWRMAHGQQSETTLRGGFGVFYDLGAGAVAANASSFPYFRNKSVFAIAGVPFPLNRSQAAPPPFSLDAPYGSFEVFDPHLKQPRTYHWGVTLEHRFDANHFLSIGYAGAAGRQLLRREAWRGFNSDYIAPLYITRNTATSDYDALQIQFQRRLSRGLQILTSYSWARSLDLASNDSAPLPPAERLDPGIDRGPSDFDVRHLLAGAVSYDVPVPQTARFVAPFLRHWSVATLFRAQTATPINVTYWRDIGFGFFPLRPDLAPGIPVFINDQNAPGGKRLNTTTTNVLGQPSLQIGPFLMAKEPRQGTLERNALRGFPLWQIDFAVQRQFILNKQLKLQLRADVFNLLNHPNFGNASSALTDPLFGTATSMLNRGLGTAGVNGGLNPVFQVGGPRSGQVVLKLSF